MSRLSNRNTWSKEEIVDMLIASWKRCNLTKKDVLTNQSRVSELYYKADLENTEEARQLIKAQWK